MAVLLHDRSETAGQKQREALRLPRTSAVVALFAFSSRMDRDSMRLFARTHGDEVRAAAIASTGQEVLELLHGGLRPQVLVLDALLTKPSVTQVLQEISAMQPDPEPAVLVLGARAGGNRRAQGAGPVCPVPDHAASLRDEESFR